MDPEGWFTCISQMDLDFTCINASLFPSQGTTVPRATAAWRINILVSAHHLSLRPQICHQLKTVHFLKQYIQEFFHLVRKVDEVVDPKADGHHRDEECKEELGNI